MTFKELETFLALCRLRSVSGVADELALSQPAVTRRLQNLERYLETRLFDRVGRTLHLTQAGERLQSAARKMIDLRTDTTRAIANMQGTVAGTLKISTSHHIGLHRLAPVLTDFSAAYPDVSLDLRFEDSEEAHRTVTSGNAELAVVTLDPEGPGKLDYLRIWEDPLVFIAAPTHPLSQRSDPPSACTIAQLASHPAVLPDLSTYTGRIVADLFASNNVTLQTAMSTNYLETLRMLVSAGLGWSMLPARMLNEQVVILAVEASTPTRHLGVVRDPQRSRSNAAAAFVDTLIRHADVAID